MMNSMENFYISSDTRRLNLMAFCMENFYFILTLERIKLNHKQYKELLFQLVETPDETKLNDQYGELVFQF